MDLDKLIQSRKSIKKFSDKKPDWRAIIEAINTTRYAPMAGNIFTLKFILIDDKNKIQKITEYCEQDFFSNVHYLVVVCSNPKLIKNSFEERAERYCRQQAGAAIQNFLLKIQELGLATCWVGHFTDNLIKRELKIPEEYLVEAIFPIGYASKKIGANKRKKEKTELDRILYFNQFKNKKMNPTKKLNV